MKGRCWFPALLPIVMFCALGPPAAAEDEAEKKPAADSTGASEPGEAGSHLALNEPVVFELEEVPAFGETQAAGSARVPVRYPRGQNATCRDVPAGEVKAYPALKSKRPMYGSVTFDSNYYNPQPGVTFHFVFDESGEAVKSESAKTAPETGTGDAEKPSLLQSLAKALTGSTARQALRPLSGPPVPL